MDFVALGQILKANPKTGRTSIGFDTMAFSMKSEIFLKKTSKKTCSLSLSQYVCMGKKRLCFIGGLSVVVSAACLSASNANEGLEVNYGRNWSPYVTVRGGWLFGESKFKEFVEREDVKKSVKDAYSGSVEIGVSNYDECVFVGFELGYFTGKMKLYERSYNPPQRSIDGSLDVDYFSATGDIEHFFGTCNVTLRHDLGEQTFLYGGIGAGAVRRVASFELRTKGTVVATGAAFDSGLGGVIKKWQFLGQTFAGFGVYLNANWQLTAGYRLRWMPSKLKDGDSCIKQNLLHAAEAGLTYRF